MSPSFTRPWERLGRAWREGKSDAVMHVEGYQDWRAHLRRLSVEDVRGLRILEVGCGDRAQLSLLFAADGATVVALDRRPLALGRQRPRMWAGLARSEGVASAARGIARDLAHGLRYWRNLARLSGKRLPFDGPRLVRADAAALPFPAGSFDLVISSAVWEHLPDVEAATREVARVLRDGGLAAIQIALFPALQGGHHPEWHSIDHPDRRSIRPWDHLYPDRRGLPMYLNEWRESQYRTVMERWLQIIEWEDGPLRGAPLLDGVSREQLGGFSDRDLLLSSITVWATKGPVLLAR